MYWLTFHSRKSATLFSGNFRKNFFSVAFGSRLGPKSCSLFGLPSPGWIFKKKCLCLMTYQLLFTSKLQNFFSFKNDLILETNNVLFQNKARLLLGLFFKERLIYLDLIFFEKLKALWKADIIFNVQYRFIFHLILHLYLTSFISTYVMTN